MSFIRISFFLLLVSVSAAQAGWKFEGGKAADHARVEKALAFLGRTPTGAAVLGALKDFKFVIFIDRANESNGSYDDEYKYLNLAEKSLAWSDWKLARLLCHELTHAVQDSLGINRTNYDNGDAQIPASGIVEYAALSMEVRYWIEAGAPEDSVRDFNYLRMRAYLFFPETVRIGWAFTNSAQQFKEPVASWGDVRLASYWDGVLASEAAWRSGKALPSRFKAPAIALEYLAERTKGRVSAWLPEYLERLGSVPGGASALDLKLIGLHRLGK